MLLVASYLFILIAVDTVASSNVKYVNPFIGTLKTKPNYGGMIPSTGTPFAMTRWTPMTQENIAPGRCPYLYDGKLFHGFLATHQPAVWMGESGEIAVAAGTGEVKTAFADRGMPYSHDKEVSSPHYFRTTMETSTGSMMSAEISATSRASSLRFSFDKLDTSQRFVTIQASRGGIQGQVKIDSSRREISGFNPERQDNVYGPFSAKDFKGYFVARFDDEFVSFGTARFAHLNEGSNFAEGEGVSAFIRLDPSVIHVNVRVGISYISIEQARQNLDNEIPDGTTLEETAAFVEKRWAAKLDLITLTNATQDESVIFYTGMYHALQYPNEMHEVNASGSFYYSGFDNSVHAGAAAYTGYSIWDTFRAEWAFLNLFAPERVDGMIQSMLQSFVEANMDGRDGRLPMWQNIVETNIMIGTHSSSLIAESLAKGFSGFDLQLAWDAIYKDAMVPPVEDLTTQYYDREEGTSTEARAGLTRELELGWVAAIDTSEAGSRTLEYAYDDYTVSVAAALTGHPEYVDYFLNRSRNYRNVFNNVTGFMEARYANGSWCDDRSTWTEADNWVYTFNVQHDFPGLRDLFQGAKGLERKLDEYYQGGHNDQTNEPSHATVFAYMYANAPDKVQSTVRSLLQDNYYNSPIGINGNEDCGQMSAWYIFNAIGFYPVNPASAEYIIGAPLFDKVEIKFPQSEHVLTITAAGAPSNLYVKGVSVDGQQKKSPVITHKTLLHAEQIVFEMATEPQEWGKNTV